MAAKELADVLEHLKPHERVVLTGSIDELLQGTHHTRLSVMRFKLPMAKARPEAATALRKVLILVASEGA